MLFKLQTENIIQSSEQFKLFKIGRMKNFESTWSSLTSCQNTGYGEEVSDDTMPSENQATQDVSCDKTYFFWQILLNEIEYIFFMQVIKQAISTQNKKVLVLDIKMTYYCIRWATERKKNVIVSYLNSLLVFISHLNLLAGILQDHLLVPIHCIHILAFPIRCSFFLCILNPSVLSYFPPSFFNFAWSHQWILFYLLPWGIDLPSTISFTPSCAGKFQSIYCSLLLKNISPLRKTQKPLSPRFAVWSNPLSLSKIPRQTVLLP